MQTIKLTEFLEEYQNEIAVSVIRDYPPIYTFDRRNKYVADIKQLKRSPYLAQFDAIAALAELFSTEKSASGIAVGEMGCISGDMLIPANRAKRGFKIELRKLYQKFNGINNPAGKGWDLNIPTHVRSLCGDVFRLNKIISIISKGIKPVVKICFKSGRELVCTPDHEIADDNENWIAAEDLHVGSKVLANGVDVIIKWCPVCKGYFRVAVSETAKFTGQCIRCINRRLKHRPSKQGCFKRRDGYFYQTKGVRYHPYLSGATEGIPLHRLIYEANLNGMSFDEWMDVVANNAFTDKHQFLSPDIEIHHKDRIRDNNEIDNLEAMEITEHKKIHGVYKHFKNSVPFIDEVLSIQENGEIDVYDIVVDEPYRNFVAGGIVVHNCGKSIVAIALVYACKFKKTLILGPPHLTLKWEREINITMPDNSAECHQLKKFTDVDKAIAVANASKDKFHFFIVGRERAKLSYQWRPAYNIKGSIEIVESDNGDGPQRIKTKYIACPKCGGLVLDAEGIPLQPDEMKKKKMICARCGEFLWQAKETGPRRYAIAEWIKRKHKGFFDLLVLDEVHEYRGRGTAQGAAAGILASVCKKSLGLTGTLSGGYSSSIFHLLYRITKRFKDDYGHDQVSKWIQHYGILEQITKYSADKYSDNVSSRGRKYACSPREKPGISPVILPKYLLDKTVFIRLSDIAIDLPPLREKIVNVEMNEEQAEAYDELYNQLRRALLAELQHGNKSLLAVYLQTLLTYPDRCTVGEQVYNKDEQLIASAPALNSDVLYPKEQAIIDLIKKEKAEGRRVLVFCTHTNRRDVTARLQEKIQSNGNNVRSEILKASVPAEKREAWIQEHAKDLDCLITNPALVQTGLDLIEFPTVAYCQAGYSVYTLRQSSRRSWRIGQDKPVKIYYFVYSATMQEQALKLLALKMKASLIIEGELGEDGLATYNVGDDNLFYELARNIANNVSIDESLDNLWRNVQEKEKKGATNDLLIESLDDFENKPELNGALKRPVAEIKQKYNPEIWDKLYSVMLQDRGKKQDLKRKRRERREEKLPEDRHMQVELF